MQINNKINCKQSFLKKKNKKKGFTLVELMAVMAIILILAAAFVPKVSGYIEEAKKTKVLNQAKNVVTVYETAKIKNSSITNATEASTLPDKTNLLEASDVDKLGSATVEQCFNIVDTEHYSFKINNGVFETIEPVSN